MTRFAIENAGHDRARTTVDQWLACKTIVKHERTIDCGNAALVAAVLNTLNNTFENPARMKQARWQRLVVKRRGKTEDIGVKHQASTHACTEGIPVATNNACQRATVRIKGAR